MPGIRIVTGAVVLAGVATAAGVALAAPARDSEIGGGKPTTFTWEATGSGVLALSNVYDEVGCQPGVHDCDDTLLKANESGSLTVNTTSTDPNAADADLVLYQSDASGEPGTQLQNSGGTNANESVSAKVVAGKYYLVRIHFAIAANGVVKGEAILKPSAPAATPTPGATPGPGGGPSTDAPPTVTISKPKGGKIKAISGTASDDKGVKRVELGFLTGKGKKCKQLTSLSGRTAKVKKCSQPTKFFPAKGTTSWSLKLSKPLKKGSWVVFARVTDSANQTQGGYGRANRVSVRAK